jgi:hypothetical protein
MMATRKDAPEPGRFGGNYELGTIRAESLATLSPMAALGRRVPLYSGKIGFVTKVGLGEPYTQAVRPRILKFLPVNSHRPQNLIIPARIPLC